MQARLGWHVCCMDRVRKPVARVNGDMSAPISRQLSKPMEAETCLSHAVQSCRVVA